MQAYVPQHGAIVFLRARRWRVEGVQATHHAVRLDVVGRDRRLTVVTPFDRPVTVAPRQRPVTMRRQQARARLVNVLARNAPYGAVKSATDAGIQVWPHQLEPALAVLAGHRRLLIADEVGLGKTIQAGLILAEIRRHHHRARALVIAPASLRDQWAAELRTRFGIEAIPADSAGLMTATMAAAPGGDPWHRAGVWITSADFIKQPHVFAHLPIAPWDVVVIDEAHTAAGMSDRHQACNAIARRARHVVLLSATPHAGDPQQFQRLITIGRLPSPADELVVFRRTRAHVGLEHTRTVRWQRVAPSPPMARLLDTLMQYERSVMAQVTRLARDAAVLLLAVFRRRALSTMAALGNTLARRLEWLDTMAAGSSPDWQQPSLLFDDEDEVDRGTLQADAGLPSEMERGWIRRLRGLAADATRDERKIRHLVRVVARTREPVVVFTEFRDSLERAARSLQRVRAVSTLHGGQSAQERRRQLQDFLQRRTTVLIATDAGGQGLNLQDGARWVINLELPWNPARLEQRVGRVDRIGQARRVHATLLVTAHAAESRMIESLGRRALAARRAIDNATLSDMSPPSHVAIAAAVFDGGEVPGSAQAADAVTPCTTYRRRARAGARDALHRRVLLRVWRGPGSPGPRPPIGRIAAGLSRPSHAVVLCSVPFVTSSGGVIERRLVALSVPQVSQLLACCPAVLAAIDIVARRAAAARFRRVQRMATTTAQRRALSERALASHVAGLLVPGETQLGLFSGRAARTFNEAGVAARRADEDASQAAAHTIAEGQIEMGRSTIEWIGLPR